MVNFIIANNVFFAIDSNSRHVVNMGIVVDIIVFKQGFAKEAKKGGAALVVIPFVVAEDAFTGVEANNRNAYFVVVNATAIHNYLLVVAAIELNYLTITGIVAALVVPKFGIRNSESPIGHIQGIDTVSVGRHAMFNVLDNGMLNDGRIEARALKIVELNTTPSTAIYSVVVPACGVVYFKNNRLGSIAFHFKLAIDDKAVEALKNDFNAGFDSERLSTGHLNHIHH